LLTEASNLARDFENPAVALLGLSYFFVMIVFGIYGKKWLASDMLAHGYQEVISHNNDEPLC
jgi:hypothetical protein